MKDLPPSPALTAVTAVGSPAVTTSTAGRGGRDPTTPTTTAPTSTPSSGSPILHTLTPERVVSLWDQARAGTDTMGLPLSTFQDLVREELHKASSTSSLPSSSSSSFSSSSTTSLSSYCHVLLAHASLLRLLSMERHGYLFSVDIVVAKQADKKMRSFYTKATQANRFVTWLCHYVPVNTFPHKPNLLY